MTALYSFVSAHRRGPFDRLRAGHWSLPFALCLLAFLVPSGLAAAPGPRAIDDWANDYLARREPRGFSAPLTMSEALKLQKEFVKRLQPEMGRPVGYKVGLVTREAQQKYGVEAPLRGVLLEKMMLSNGSDISRAFGVHPLIEADLVVVVKDKGINKAQSIMEVAEHLRDVIAFIELPDAFLPTNPPPTGALLTAGNVGARLGVLGQRIPVVATAAFAKAIGEMTAIITDDSSRELGRGQGKVILDHPFNSVLWLIEELRRAGEKLKPGDMISLGSIKALPLPNSKAITVRYEGLPGGPISVSVMLH
jgi:2-keto-4-pentenoate hydratase